MNLKASWLISFVLLILVHADSLWAGIEKHDIKGNIYYSKTGTIYVYLVTEEVFKKPLTGLQTIVLDGNASAKSGNGVFFHFRDVPIGVYGIRCFQDTNGNGKLDQGLFGPSEPWGMSWNSGKPSSWPRYENISFVNEPDLPPLKIELE
jgi:uncharacterized protein (DUF2141 family)